MMVVVIVSLYTAVHFDVAYTQANSTGLLDWTGCYPSVAAFASFVLPHAKRVHLSVSLTTSQVGLSQIAFDVHWFKLV